jgi:hypothetical protein
MNSVGPKLHLPSKDAAQSTAAHHPASSTGADLECVLHEPWRRAGGLVLGGCRPCRSIQRPSARAPKWIIPKLGRPKPGRYCSDFLSGTPTCLGRRCSRSLRALASPCSRGQGAARAARRWWARVCGARARAGRSRSSSRSFAVHRSAGFRQGRRVSVDSEDVCGAGWGRAVGAAGVGAGARLSVGRVDVRRRRWGRAPGGAEMGTRA